MVNNLGIAIQVEEETFFTFFLSGQKVSGDFKPRKKNVEVSFSRKLSLHRVACLLMEGNIRINSRDCFSITELGHSEAVKLH